MLLLSRTPELPEQTHVVPGAFSKGGWTYMKDAIAHVDRYANGEQWVLGDDFAAE